MHSLLNQFKSIVAIPIAWGDMDAAQHVNNIMYLRYGETSRIAYMQSVGLGFDLSKTGVILAEINCKYKMPLTFPDTIWVGTRALLDSFDDYSFWTEQIVVSQKKQRVSAVIQAKLVGYDFSNLKKSAYTKRDKENIFAFENPEKRKV
ncbi:MAG: acyl-CoA thioesterase [Saprospiraceae bacterium]|nr:acyl-CoA thioesterase [Saprospiraceae bacterium]